jgi:hypothetical protein
MSIPWSPLALGDGMVDSRATTKNPPTASNAPRKERLLFGDNPESESFADRFSEYSASPASGGKPLS